MTIISTTKDWFLPRACWLQRLYQLLEVHWLLPAGHPAEQLPAAAKLSGRKKQPGRELKRCEWLDCSPDKGRIRSGPAAKECRCSKSYYPERGSIRQQQN